MQPILFIAGGIWQKPFVEYLKSKGQKVVIVNPVKTDTTELADFHVECDINDLKTINEHIRLLNPIAITSDQSDVSTAIVSELSSQWGLLGNKPEVIRKFTNKYDIYKFASSINVPVPFTEVAQSTGHIKDFGSHHGYPIIIKPVDSTMSRGFRKFDSEKDVTEESFQSSLRFSKSNQVIVQNFIPGDMVTLEGACSGGKHVTLATSRKSEYFKAGITSGVRYPASYPDDFMEKIIEVNNKYVEMSGMEFGLTHSEYLVGDDFCLLEIGARGGGAGITNKIVPWVSGINTYDILYDSLMGKIIDVKSIKPLRRFALLRYYREEDVTVQQAEQIKSIPGVSVFCHNFVGTQYVADKNDCRYTMGIYLTENKEEMNSVEGKVNAICKL